MFGLHCRNRNPLCYVPYEGEEHALRVFTAETVISDLVLADCFTMVRADIRLVFDIDCAHVVQEKLTTTSVKAFHEWQCHQYNTYSDTRFCSPNTFRVCYYAWLFKSRAEKPPPDQ
jgi:hypothetical protein